MKATRRDWLKQCALSSAFFTASAAKPLPAHVVSKNEQTSIGGSAAKYGRMLNQLRDLITARTRVTTLRGSRRRFNHYWLRDQVHVMKALKYWEQDLSSMLEFFLEQQTPSGMYWDHAMPLNHTHSRTQIFDPKYWMVCEEEGRLYMRLPVEADCEYLAVEGAYLVWQITGDDAWMMKWLPTLERGLRYCMNDPLRWSKKYQLVKRGYTIDTWDFQQTPPDMEAWGGGRQKVIFDIDENTPMGIMHGDNSGMFAACGQLAEMYQAAGVPRKAEQWKKEAAGFRARTNETCWNGKYYAHFVEDDPLPDYVKMDPQKSITLSNSYSINRGLPNHEMAASIIRQYKKMEDEHQGQSFAEWYCMYPPVKPHWAGYEPGNYMNGGITTIVAGELAKAAFQHGYEQYG
ncbi:hypothetical protein GF373_05315, partial [bacterium]|nr:hypothetical protein [bacterium]